MNSCYNCYLSTYLLFISTSRILPGVSDEMVSNFLGAVGKYSRHSNRPLGVLMAQIGMFLFFFYVILKSMYNLPFKRIRITYSTYIFMGANFLIFRYLPKV